MKKLLLILSLLTFCILLNAQNRNINIGTIDTINSQILKEKRSVWIYKPDNFDVNKKYPVIYLLDGDWHFLSVVGMVQQLSFINGNTICPEMIIVGIPIKDRFRDLTPTRDSTISKTSGGYSNFISFIGNELIPYINSTYPTSPYKVFIGHSLGGLTVVNTLMRFPDMFNSYIAIDPSMWWDNQLSLKDAKTVLSSNKFESKRLFLAIAKNMNKGMDTSSVRNDNTRNTLSIRSNLIFSDILKANANNKLNFQMRYYINESHGSVPLIATYDALHFIFDFYNLTLDKIDYADTTMSLGYRVDNHYKIISEKMGYRINPSESLINTLGYSAMFMNNFALAEYFFKMNVANYPKSYNAYDSYGDYHVAVGNKEQAIIMYKKALALNDNLETKKKLEDILKR